MLKDEKKVKEVKKEDLYKLLVNKMRIIDYNIRILDRCTVNRDFFYTSVPNGEVGDKMTFKLIDLYHEFAEEIYEYCKTNKIKIKAKPTSKEIHFIKK